MIWHFMQQPKHSSFFLSLSLSLCALISFISKLSSHTQHTKGSLLLGEWKRVALSLVIRSFYIFIRLGIVCVVPKERERAIMGLTSPLLLSLSLFDEMMVWQCPDNDSHPMTRQFFFFVLDLSSERSHLKCFPAFFFFPFWYKHSLVVMQVFSAPRNSDGLFMTESAVCWW